MIQLHYVTCMFFRFYTRKDDKMAKRIFIDLCDEKSGVTGTCQLFNAYFPGKSLGANGPTNEIPFIFDCGSFQGEDNEEDLNASFKFDIAKPEFGILSHAHFDHYGRYPLAIKNGFQAPIFTTYVTKTFLSQLFLDDCLKIEMRAAKKKGIEPLYSELDSQKMREFMVGCAYQKRIQYNDNISIFFFDNGHVPGAAVTLIQLSYPGYEEINIVVSGDYNDHNMFFKVNPLPEWVYNLKNVIIIIESTYGTTKLSDLSPACFIKYVVQALKQGNTVLVPSFSFGRQQEIDYTLKEAQDTNILPLRYSIYNDGKSAIGCTNLFLQGTFNMYPHTRDFLPQNLTFVEGKEFRYSLINDPSPKVVVASSGMCSHGPSSTYLSRLALNPKVTIIAPGYVSPNSKLGKLRDSDDAVAELLSTDEFSAHGKLEVLKAFIKPFKRENVKAIGVTHGNPEVRVDFVKDLEDTFGIPTFNITSDYIYRLTSDGLVQKFERKTESK